MIPIIEALLQWILRFVRRHWKGLTFAVVVFGIVPPVGIELIQRSTARDYIERGEQGVVWAQFRAGKAYAEGIGVKQDHAEAARWYRRAAEQGHVRSQVRLGRQLQDGIGVEENHVEAVRWYLLAAERGWADAMLELEEMYRLGKGVEVDLAEAYKWYWLVREHWDRLALARPVREYLTVFAVLGVAFAVADITDEQMAEGKRRAEEWQPTCDPYGIVEPCELPERERTLVR